MSKVGAVFSARQLSAARGSLLSFGRTKKNEFSHCSVFSILDKTESPDSETEHMDITTTAAAFVLRYDAMSDMCKKMETENKRLLQLVADKDVIIAAGLQREKEANDKHIKLSAENLELMQEKLKMIRDDTEFMGEIVKLLDGEESTCSDNDERSDTEDSRESTADNIRKRRRTDD